MSEENLRVELERIRKERDAYADALTTSNTAFMEKVKEFSIIKRLADSLKEGMNRRHICTEIVDIIIDETTAENCSLWLMDLGNKQLSLYAARGQGDMEPRYYDAGEGNKLRVGMGAAGWAAQHGESLLIEDVGNSPYFIPDESGPNIRSLLCLPIKGSGGKVLGVLNMSHPDIGVFSSENERVLQLITDQAGVGLTNFQLFQDIQKLNRELEHKVEERTRHLSESEERYERAISAGRVGIWDWKVGTHEMYVAPNLKAMLGYEDEEITHLNAWLGLMLPEDRKRFLKEILRYMKSQRDTYEGEHRMYHKDGHLVWFFVRGAAIRDEQGRLTRLSGSNSDITKRKQAEIELARAQEEALVNAHAAGKAEFATTVLHNIGNVLNSVNVDSLHIRKTLEGMRLTQLAMACGLLKEHHDDLAEFLVSDPRGSKLPEYLDRVADVIARDADKVSSLADNVGNKIDLMRDIIETQQNYATANKGALLCDLGSLAEEALKVQMDSISKRGVVLKQQFEETPQVLVNAPKLIHVIINLTKNAVEAMARLPEGERVLRVSVALDDEGQVCLAICDSGIGIKPENLEKIFTHGFTTKKSGHGFGLHYCARTLEAMGGRISVHSDGEGCGATFRLCFPPAPVGKRHDDKE